jgi:molybdopterin/thiamine biosynthesis adenylyltransferase
MTAALAPAAGLRPPSESAVGLPKVAVARAHLRAVNPWSEVACVGADVASLAPGELAGVDVALLAFDNDRARAAANRLLLAARVPFVDAGARADLRLTRASIVDPRSDGPCLLCGWGAERLAEAGEDVGLPCAGAEPAGAWPSTLTLGHAAAGVAVLEALALAGLGSEAPRPGTEVRLDLRRGRLERFTVARDAGCVAEHALASGVRTVLSASLVGGSVGALLAAAGAAPDDVVLLGRTELVVRAACPRAHDAAPHVPAGAPLPACAACGGALAPLRRARRFRAGDLPAEILAARAANLVRPGDAFAIEPADGGAAHAFVLPGAAAPWEPGASLPDGPARFARLPAELDLARIRRTRIALLGLGHVGAAALAQLAPLPWAGILLVDRDRVKRHNLASHALGARAAGGTGEAA